MSTDDIIFSVLGTVGLVVAIMWAIGEYRIKKENKRRDAEAKARRIDLPEIGETVLEAMPEDRDLDRRYSAEPRHPYTHPLHANTPTRFDDTPRNLYVVPMEASCQDYSSSSSSVGSQPQHSSPSSSSKGCFGSGGSSFSDSGSSGDGGGGE